VHLTFLHSPSSCHVVHLTPCHMKHVWQYKNGVLFHTLHLSRAQYWYYNGVLFHTLRLSRAQCWYYNGVLFHTLFKIN